jgi:hypothetical protein
VIPSGTGQTGREACFSRIPCRFLAGKTLTANQIQFVNLVIGVFDSAQVGQMLSALDAIRQPAVRNTEGQVIPSVRQVQSVTGDLVSQKSRCTGAALTTTCNRMPLAVSQDSRLRPLIFSRRLHRSDYLHLPCGTAILWDCWAALSVWCSRQLDIRRWASSIWTAVIRDSMTLNRSLSFPRNPVAIMAHVYART